MSNPMKKVLIVDSKINLAKILAMVITKINPNYEIEYTTHPFEALQKASVAPYDILLTDYRMVDMDGLALSRAIREICPTIFIALITDYHSPELQKQAMQSRIDAYLTKPFSANDIRQLLKSIAEYKKVDSQAITPNEGLSHFMQKQLDDLLISAHAHYVFLLHESGKILAQAGRGEELNMPCLGPLLANHFRSLQELANALGEPMVFQSNYHEGQEKHIYMESVQDEVMLGLFFGREAKMGLVRFYAHETAVHLAPLLIQIGSLVERQLPNLFQEELDKLFVQ